SSPKANCDTSEKIYDTKFLRLYRVNEIYYYRRRVNGKLVRISLRTKKLQEALKRKRALDLLKGEELFELTTKDFKLVFEYDTEEELRIALENATRLQIQQQLQHYKTVKNQVEMLATDSAHRPEKFTFEELKEKYISQAIYDGNVKESSIVDYTTTFNRLIDYFKDKDINELTVQDIEAFKLHLNTIIVRKKNLSKKTINKHLIYTKQFLKFAKEREYILKNVAEPVKLYNKRQTKAEEKKAENFTDEEIRALLTKKEDRYYDKTLKLFIKIAIYSGMRLGEINSLTNDSIKQDNKTGIYYFDLQESKTINGIRKIPIHYKILEEVLQTDFPLYKDKSEDSLQKKLNRQIKKVVNAQPPKTFHGFRGTFMQKAVNNFPEIFVVTQDIVGHSKDDKASLTIDIYAQGFNLELKQKVINSVDYFS
ncbi:tyrosine-type recombinase/integrase, partial [Sulfurimonas sp.]